MDGAEKEIWKECLVLLGIHHPGSALVGKVCVQKEAALCIKTMLKYDI